jgi:hypothetical protein
MPITVLALACLAIYGGNDGRVMLLTEEMQDFIESIGDVMDHDSMPRRVEQIKAGGGR